MKIQSTRVYAEVSNAVRNGYKVVSAQGSSRSSKTYNILIFLIVYCLQHPKTVLSVVRKTLPALKGSAFRDFKEIMQDKFKLWDNRAMNKSDMIYALPNGSFVEFFSTDDEQKIRGRKRDVLYCNEANEISFLEWQQLVMRTTTFSVVDYNPSFSDEHWLCELNKDPRTYHFISTYKDNPFLEQTIINEIESLRHKNKALWTVYGLGQQAMAEGLIFPEFDIVDEFPHNAKHVAAGMDFGYATDPTAIVKCGIIDDKLYMDEQCYKTHMLTNEIISELKRMELHVYADSADPRLIQEIANAGIVIYPADKYKGSVMGGLTKMMEYRFCVTRRSVNLIKELKNYVYDKNKDGKFINEPIDAYNHCFTGDTAVATTHGSKRIDSINVGDYVLTSDGYRKVYSFFDNGHRTILHVRLILGDGCIEIKATPDHKIKTEKGWKQLQNLTKGDVLYIHKSSMGKSTNFTPAKDISHVVVKAVAKHLFAISTAKLNIAAGLVPGNMFPSLKKAADLIPKRQSLSVSFAGVNIMQSQLEGISSVAKNAGINLLQKQGYARYAENRSCRTIKQDFVVSSVLEDIILLDERVEHVYDIEVEDMHEFFANGILVHNCIDSIRYYIIGKVLGKVLTNKIYTKEDLGFY